MAVTATSMIYPTGYIQAGWFKDGEDPTTTITAWIAAETDGERSDRAVSLRVTARAYGMVADRIAATPIKRSYGGNGGKSDEYDVAQIAHWRSLQDDALYQAEAEDLGPASSAKAGSVVVPVYSAW